MQTVAGAGGIHRLTAAASGAARIRYSSLCVTDIAARHPVMALRQVSGGLSAA
jgi:hypothetical protein